MQYCFAPGVYPPPARFTFAAGVSTVDFVVAALRYFRAEGLERGIADRHSSDATGQEGERVIRQGLALPENKDMSVVQAALFQHHRCERRRANVAHQGGRSTGDHRLDHRHAVRDGAAQLRQCRAHRAAFTNSGNIAQQADGAIRRLRAAAALFRGRHVISPIGRPHIPTPSKTRSACSSPRIKQAGINPDTGPSSPGIRDGSSLTRCGDSVPSATGDRLHAYLEQLHGFVGINGAFDFRNGKQRGLTLDSAILVRWDGGEESRGSRSARPAARRCLSRSHGSGATGRAAHSRAASSIVANTAPRSVSRAISRSSMSMRWPRPMT